MYKSVISDNVFVILGYLDDSVLKKLYNDISDICTVLVVYTKFNCTNIETISFFSN